MTTSSQDQQSTEDGVGIHRQIVKRISEMRNQ